MAEIRNNFLKSRMNKDLDDRLVPDGEYRDALNVNISRSEGDSVGAVQTALGNLLITDLGHSEDCTLKIVGFFANDNTNSIFIFLTDYIDTSVDKLSQAAPETAVCEIWRINFNTGTNTKLVEGNYLNFSLTHNINGIDLLEDLLFWTDGRNQPRKINITKANPSNLFNPTYYTNEDQISVAKYYPYEPISLIQTYIDDINFGCGFQPDCSQSCSAGGSGSIVTPNLFWANGVTDNTVFNTTNCTGDGQGLTIQITSTDAYTGGDGSITGWTIIDEGVGYKDGDVIWIGDGDIQYPALGELSVITESTMKDKCNEHLPWTASALITNITTDQIEFNYAQDFLDAYTGNSYPYTVDHTDAPQGALIVINQQRPELGYAVVTEIVDDSTIEVSYDSAAAAASITALKYPCDGISAPPDCPGWDDDDTLFFAFNNPNYDEYWAGDCDYLKERFVKFSYRFKFTDGEYSLMAPFTQTAFVPENDGYFVFNDEENTYKSTNVDFMQNKISEVGLIIPCPEFLNLENTWNTAARNMHIAEIQILAKDEENNNVLVIDDIPIGTLAAHNNRLISYLYQSKAPYKVIPQREIFRVSDVTPIRAQAQSISGNRVIYGNYIDKHSSLSTLNYTVSGAQKSQGEWSGITDADSNIRKEYQNHTLKQNRTYQVGVVLSDRYGRQTDVILSNADLAIQDGGGSGITFGGSTYFHSYKASPFSASTDFLSLPGVLTGSTWPGDSLFLYFNQIIPNTAPVKGYPGLFLGQNDDAAISDLYGGGGYASPNFAGGWVTDIATTGGTGNGMTIDYQTNYTFPVESYVTNVVINNPGSGYVSGDVITFPPDSPGPRGAATFVYEPATSFSNTLGFYSYKVVVKQQEQEYYNLYLPGIINGELDSQPSPSDTQAYISLLGDNLNKVPIDVTEAQMPTQVGFSSEVKLHSRVVTKTDVSVNYSNFQSYPAIATDKVITIGTLRGLGLGNPEIKSYEAQGASTSTTLDIENPNETALEVATAGSQITILDGTGVYLPDFGPNDNAIIQYATGGAIVTLTVNETVPAISAGDTVTIYPPLSVFQGRSNPYVASLKSHTMMGQLSSDFVPNLAVFETSPVESKLEIFWESTTSGKISDLNTQIRLDSGSVISSLSSISFNLSEGDGLGVRATNDFWPVDGQNQAVIDPNAQCWLSSVVDGEGNDRSLEFEVVPASTPGEFYIQSNSYQTVVNNSDLTTFFFNITTIVNTVFVYSTLQGIVANVAPQVLNNPVNPIVLGFNGQTEMLDLIELEVTNGSADPNNEHKDLQLEILSAIVTKTSQGWGQNRGCGALCLNTVYQNTYWQGPLTGQFIDQSGTVQELDLQSGFLPAPGWDTQPTPMPWYPWVYPLGTPLPGNAFNPPPPPPASAPGALTPSDAGLNAGTFPMYWAVTGVLGISNCTGLNPNEPYLPQPFNDDGKISLGLHSENCAFTTGLGTGTTTTWFEYGPQNYLTSSPSGSQNQTGFLNGFAVNYDYNNSPTFLPVTSASLQQNCSVGYPDPLKQNKCILKFESDLSVAGLGQYIVITYQIKDGGGYQTGQPYSIVIQTWDEQSAQGIGGWGGRQFKVSTTNDSEFIARGHPDHHYDFNDGVIGFYAPGASAATWPGSMIGAGTDFATVEYIANYYGPGLGVDPDWQPDTGWKPAINDVAGSATTATGDLPSNTSFWADPFDPAISFFDPNQPDYRNNIHVPLYTDPNGPGCCPAAAEP